MKDLILGLVERLERGDFKNESEISRGIVLKILNALGWDTFDTNIVMSEYSIGNGRVDFALARKKGATPSVFIEVKQPGKTDNADGQLFKYAFDEGVPFAILTDGKTWSFYLPSGQGAFSDRRIYQLDLVERTPEESEDKLKRYLDFERVKTGVAFDDAQKDYRSKFKAEEAKAAIPEAWKELVDAEDDALFKILKEAVEKKSGYEPKHTDIADFFAKIRFIPDERHFTPTETPRKKGSSERNTDQNFGSWYSIKGRVYQVPSAKRVVIDLLNCLYDNDSSFFEKCLNHESNFGRNRQYIASKKSDLYKGNPRLQDMCVKLNGGYYLLTNFSNAIKDKILKMAFEIGGVRKGVEIDYKL